MVRRAGYSDFVYEQKWRNRMLYEFTKRSNSFRFIRNSILKYIFVIRYPKSIALNILIYDSTSRNQIILEN